MKWLLLVNVLEREREGGRREREGGGAYPKG